MIKNKKLKIAHIHVWDKSNKGDYAIVLAVQEILHKNFPSAVISNFPVEVLKNNDIKEIAKLNRADFIIIGGGGILYSYFLPFNLKTIDEIIKPIYLFGLGYIKEVDAPLWKQDKIDSVTALANKARGIGVRDLNTKRFLIASGIKPKKIQVVGDPAAFLIEKKPSVATISKLSLLSRKKKIGVNLNYSGWLGFGRWREDILHAYQETIDYFQNKLGFEVYYLKHHPGEENIYPALEINNLKLVDLKPNEQKYVYGKLDLIIGMMLHVGVMAYGAKTPEISVAYDVRNYGFAEFINHPELVISLEKLKDGELLRRSKAVISKKASYRKKFVKKKNEMGGSVSKFIQEIKNNLN